VEQKSAGNATNAIFTIVQSVEVSRQMCAPKIID